MTAQPTPQDPTSSHAGAMVSRRRLLQGAAVSAGALSAVAVIDSLPVSTAAASSPNYGPNTVIVDTWNGIDPGPIDIPSNRQVKVEIIGGGGGGGMWSQIGGVGTKVTGTLDGAGTWYTLNYQVGQGGGGGKTSYTGNGGVNGAGSGGAAGGGFVPGGAGGDNGGNNSSNGNDASGGGGGGGGASAVWIGTQASPTSYVIAPGGPGSGGGGGHGGSGNWRLGGAAPNSPSGALNQIGNDGNAGTGSGSLGGKGGRLPPPPATANGGTTAGGNPGSNGTNSTGGAGGSALANIDPKKNGGGGGGGGGGGWCGGGGGASDVNSLSGHYPGASGGTGSAVASGTFSVTPSCAAAGAQTSTNGVPTYSGPGGAGWGSQGGPSPALGGNQNGPTAQKDPSRSP